MDAGEPEISAIVITRNAAALLPPLLERLGRQTLAAGRFEVLVVDNGSTDDGADLARAAGVRVIEDPRPHRANARNLGAEHARSDLIAYTDADCMPSEGWLEALLGCAAEEAIVAGPVEVTTSPAPNAVERFERLWRFDQAAWVGQGWAATANMCVRREVMDAVGGFDTAYRTYGEDVDFCTRATRAGYAVVYCPGAAVTHVAESRLGPMLARSFRHGYGSHQAHRRLGEGYRAWRRPGVLRGDRALRMFGARPESFAPDEWARMARLARAAYASRMLGSLWGELRRVR